MMRAGIVGAGIMGRLLALTLNKRGWDVTLFEKGLGNDNCSYAAAGLLTPFSELDKAPSIICELGQYALQTAWPKILHDCSLNIDFRTPGCLVLTHPKDQSEWDFFSQRIKSQLPQAKGYYKLLSTEALTQLEPSLTHFDKGYYFPAEAQIDTQALMQALTQYLDHQQGICYLKDHLVTALRPFKLISQDQSYSFDFVFDCRGLGAKEAWLNLRALRGELLWLQAPEVQLQRPIRLLHPRYSLYIVPRSENRYLIGASEIEAEDYSPISVRTTLELLTAAYYLHSGFIEARILQTVTHCRPTLSDHLPHLQYQDGLIKVNGLYRHGYLIAPSLVDAILSAIDTQGHSLPYPTLWEKPA
jgi:glycine oxidase